MFQRTRIPAFAIAFVCALHEQCTPTSMLEKKLKNTNFSLVAEVGVIFPEGANPLCAGVTPEALASRKVVYCEVCTEGSETAKSGTDEQERYMRHNCLGKQAHLCNALRLQEKQLCRYRRNWRKEEALTRGDLGVFVQYTEKSAEAIVGEHSMK